MPASERKRPDGSEIDVHCPEQGSSGLAGRLAGPRGDSEGAAVTYRSKAAWQVVPGSRRVHVGLVPAELVLPRSLLQGPAPAAPHPPARRWGRDQGRSRHPGRCASRLPREVSPVVRGLANEPV